MSPLIVFARQLTTSDIYQGIDIPRSPESKHMAIAGHIVANLTANTTGWSSGLRGAIGPLNAVAAVITGMAAAAVNQFSTFGDEIDKMRSRTGLTAVELSQLSHAAGLSDTSLGSLQSGLTKMQKFMRETSQGTKSAVAVLDELGISAGQLQSATNNEKLGIFADALARIDDPGQRAAVAMEVFGKGAVDLLPLLAGGSAGLREMTDEADRLGLTMSDEAADSAALLNDTIGRLKGTLTGLVTTVGADLAPMVISVVSEFTEWVAQNRELVVLLIKSAIVMASVVGALKLMMFATQAYAKAQAVALALTGPKGWLALIGSLAAATAATTMLATQFDATNAKLDKAGEETAKVQAAMDAKTEAVTRATPAVRNYASAMDNLLKSYNAFLPQSVQVRNSLREQEADWNALAKAGHDTGITWTQLQGLKLKTILGESGWNEEFDSLNSELAVLRGEITETEQKFANMAKFGVDTKHIDALKSLNAERNKLASEQLAKEKAAEDERQKITDTKSRVHAGIATPYADFAREVKAVNDAVRAGQVDQADGLKYLEQKRTEYLDAERRLAEEKPPTLDKTSAMADLKAKREAFENADGRADTKKDEFKARAKEQTSALKEMHKKRAEFLAMDAAQQERYNADMVAAEKEFAKKKQAAGASREAKDNSLAELERKRQELLAAEKRVELANAQQPDEVKGKQASNVGLDARSQQANQMIVDLVNRRGAAKDSSVEARKLAAAEAARVAAEASAKLLTDIRDEQRRREHLETRPFGQRGQNG